MKPRYRCIHDEMMRKMMTRDKFLTERVLGECWHEWKGNYCTCGQIGEIGSGHIIANNNNFSTPEGFFKLLTRTIGMEKDIHTMEIITYQDGQIYLSIHFSNGKKEFVKLILNDLPDTFANIIARCRGWEGEE